MAQIKGYLLDPKDKTVCVVEFEQRDIGAIQRFIGCSMFTAVGVDSDGNTLYLDDEGLYASELNFFVHEGHPEPLVGRALLLGTDSEGDSITPTISVEQFLQQVDPIIMVTPRLLAVSGKFTLTEAPQVDA